MTAPIPMLSPNARLDKIEKAYLDLAGHVAQLQRNAIKNNFDLNRTQAEVQELKKNVHSGQGFIYVASPYTDPNPDIRHRRYNQAMWYVMNLLRSRQWCYSPIVHCHEMARIHGLPTEARFWMDYNFAMLSQAKELHVYCLPGWEASVGVAAEIGFWRNGKNSSVKFIEP